MAWLWLLVLLLLSDLLFWHQWVGVSLALFAVAIFAATTLDVRPRRQLLQPLLLLLCAALPVVEFAQLLSVAFLFFGLVVSVVWAWMPDAPWPQRLRAAGRFVLGLPLDWLKRLNPVTPVRAMMAWANRASETNRAKLIRNWAFPIGGTLLFGSLTIGANPIFSQLLTFGFVTPELVERAVFWSGIALFVSPFVAGRPPSRAPHKPSRISMPELGINTVSVLRGLIMFNLVIGAQMLSDAAILIGGVDLPPGVTYAEYAHRGAYPLLATALLAGGIAVAVRPCLEAHPLIRPLLLVWLGQNLLLCASAALRLDAYVDAYGLTYLRLHAFIWMGLVAVGLGLCVWQTLRARQTSWLLMRVAALALAVLYLCSFVNFAHVIAAAHVDREKTSGALDVRYLCDLGPTAYVPLAQAGLSLEHYSYCSAKHQPRIRGWRDWGYRKARVRRNVAHMTGQEGNG